MTPSLLLPAPGVRDADRAPAALFIGPEIVPSPAAGRPPGARNFTAHNRAISAAGETARPPLPGALPAVLLALGVALRSELRRRSLWESPPAYLGICGWDSWISVDSQRRGGPGRPFGGGAFDELLAECYSYIFIDRRRSLEAQLALKPNIDGLVFLNIRHFLHERQRQFDPLGFRVFAVVRSAVRACLAAGVLHVVDGDARVRNDSVLAFDPTAAPTQADAAGLDAWISRVNDELLPGLVTARGKRLEEVIARLAERLIGLREQGTAVFRFRDLVNPCKDDVRTRWSAILGGEQGVEMAGMPPEAGAGDGRAAGPDNEYENLESFRALVACVPAALARYQTTKQNRLHLAALWQYLRLYSTGECGDPGEAPEMLRDVAVEAASVGGPPRRRRRHPGRPSDRTLADLLRIPRQQLPQLFATLGRMVEHCRCAGVGKAPADGGGRHGQEKRRKEERAPGTSPH